ncbi:hypothetical protein LFLEISCH_14372, partial [Listeria fleischmannii subsp. fleischmannii LU2006-1]
MRGKAVYETYANQHHGMLIRDDAWWDRLMRRGYIARSGTIL